MVEKIITLDGEGGGIRLQAAFNGWTKCHFLSVNDEPYFLGAQMSSYLRECLTSIISKKLKPSSGVIDGNEVMFILSLSEEHHTFYGVYLNNTLLIYVQNKEAQVVNKLRVSANQLEIWKNKLTNF